MNCNYNQDQNKNSDKKTSNEKSPPIQNKEITNFSTQSEIEEDKTLHYDLPETHIKSWNEEEPYRIIPVPHSDDALDNLAELYNQSVNDRSARQTFWDKYPNIFRIGNINAVDQSLGKATEIEFQEVPNGDFLAIENPIDKKYMVVPQFDITIKDTTYQEGGISFAFNCDNYVPSYSYSNVKVHSPAVFNRSGDKWNLSKKGNLIL